MSESNAIGERIAALRESRKKTQADLAKALNVKRETVSQWEKGTRDLKTQYTISLADYFGVTCDEILRGVVAENVDTHRKTGLSNGAIRKLSMIKGRSDDENNFHQDRYLAYLDVLNFLIEDANVLGSLDAISLISEYFYAYFVPDGVDMDTSTPDGEDVGVSKLTHSLTNEPAYIRTFLIENSALPLIQHKLIVSKAAYKQKMEGAENGNNKKPKK